MCNARNRSLLHTVIHCLPPRTHSTTEPHHLTVDNNSCCTCLGSHVRHSSVITMWFSVGTRVPPLNRPRVSTKRSVDSSSWWWSAPFRSHPSFVTHRIENMPSGNTSVSDMPPDSCVSLSTEPSVSISLIVFHTTSARSPSRGWLDNFHKGHLGYGNSVGANTRHIFGACLTTVSNDGSTLSNSRAKIPLHGHGYMGWYLTRIARTQPRPHVINVPLLILVTGPMSSGSAPWAAESRSCCIRTMSAAEGVVFGELSNLEKKI